jgi:hypothetical protein
MNAVIDTRVSPQMRERLLVNKNGKLHPQQWSEVVYEPIVRALLIAVPAIILLRGYLLTLFVGGLWMLGLAALLIGGFALFRRARRYRRVTIYFAVFRAPDKLPPKWSFWKPVILLNGDQTAVSFKHNLASDRHFQSGQEYYVYYLKSKDANTLLSFAPTDHLESGAWKPA